MNELDVLFTLIGFTCGVIVTIFVMSYSLKNLKEQISKLRGQVYYWSRQIPVSKGKRPKGNKSV
tara:strand:- start:172 stop:363 length:192 start_codon:yes stop_codon:yes gene_type:complete